MIARRLVFAALACARAGFGADSLVTQAAVRAEQKAAQAPQPLAVEFRLRAAQAIRERDPERSRKIVEAVMEQLRGGSDWALPLSGIQ